MVMVPASSSPSFPDPVHSHHHHHRDYPPRPTPSIPHQLPAILSKMPMDPYFTGNNQSITPIPSTVPIQYPYQHYLTYAQHASREPYHPQHPHHHRHQLERTNHLRSVPAGLSKSTVSSRIPSPPSSSKSSGSSFGMAGPNHHQMMDLSKVAVTCDEADPMFGYPTAFQQRSRFFDV